MSGKARKLSIAASVVGWGRMMIVEGAGGPLGEAASLNPPDKGKLPLLPGSI